MKVRRHLALMLFAAASAGAATASRAPVPAGTFETILPPAPGVQSATVQAFAMDVVPVTNADFKVYLLRTSTLQPKGGNFALGWKQSPRGAVDGARPEESTPTFAEMASPGTVFRGHWDEKDFFLQPEVRRTLRWPESFGRAKIFEAANIYAAGLISLQRQYASWAGLGLLDKNLDDLEQRLAVAREKGGCLFSLGWGGGLTAKSAWLDTTNAEYRQILQQYTIYNRALSSNLPFPKTRRIVFLNNRPATLPGWVELEIE